WLWRQDNRLAGLGFLAGSLAFTRTGLLLLRRYLNRLIFNILCSQPVMIRPRQGWLSRLGNWAQRRYLVRYPRQQTDFDDDRLAQMDGKEKG
ncbi:MAG: hypothetical protein PHR21_05000, partial [Oscillospiraceae bacterium]|nr:hypothetical protein [Oscillospiraceae bacterium]